MDRRLATTSRLSNTISKDAKNDGAIIIAIGIQINKLLFRTMYNPLLYGNAFLDDHLCRTNAVATIFVGIFFMSESCKVRWNGILYRYNTIWDTPLLSCVISQTKSISGRQEICCRK